MSKKLILGGLAVTALGAAAYYLFAPHEVKAPAPAPKTAGGPGDVWTYKFSYGPAGADRSGDTFAVYAEGIASGDLAAKDAEALRYARTFDPADTVVQMLRANQESPPLSCIIHDTMYNLSGCAVG